MQNYDVTRFVEMYDSCYDQVASELRNGRKESHWMWFIFPQIRGLGRSRMSVYYGIRDLDEARAFLASPCGERMRRLLGMLLELPTSDPAAVFGHIDAVKLASSMTLFAEAEPCDPIFGRVLDKFYRGVADEKTLRLLGDRNSAMTPGEFLKRFLPAYERGDMETLHEVRRAVFEETMRIVRNGSYVAADGSAVALPVPAEMMTGSRLYRSVAPATLPERPEPTVVEVWDSDSLLAGEKLVGEGYRPAVLNFANRHTAGGGVRYGAGAQEENIFRRSDLAWSLYQFHPDGVDYGIPQRPERYPMDRTTGGAYSPGVTVFRGAEAKGYPLLAKPYRLGIVTVAAMNRPELDGPDRIAGHLVEPVREKMRTIFRIALENGHDALVLGAWGCGAFRNPPRHIAKLFHEIMEEDEFRNRFRKIVFAIVDRRKEDVGPGRIGNFLPFQEEFFASPGAAAATRRQQDPAERFRRFKGMFWGLVVGDCLGSPIQFMDKDDHPHVTEMLPCRRFSTPPGYWTDDSAMAFCVAESVVRMERYDLADIGRNFVRWYEDGFWSSLSYAFDIGMATHVAVRRIAQGSLRNGDEDSQGNGSIMRFAPSYILGYRNADRRILHEISDLTHCSGKVRETVDLMAKICDEHLLGERTGEKSVYRSREEVNNSGWAVSTLQAALWAFETTSSFEEGLIAAVNLGGDADSIGAVFGQIAGAYYGFDAIPERWLAAVKSRDRIDELVEAFIRLAETRGA